MSVAALVAPKALGQAFVVEVAPLAAILVLRFAAPRVPGALVLVVGGLVASNLFDLPAEGAVTRR